MANRRDRLENWPTLLSILVSISSFILLLLLNESPTNSNLNHTNLGKYSLRTSDCTHLIEACNFYAAIRARGYFNILNKDVRSSLVVKKLRYYARYIIVCLLLKRMKLVKDLVREFSQSLNDYSHVYEPEAQLEWSLVLQEIKAFIEAESKVSVVSGPGHTDGPGVILTLSQRLNSTNVPPPLKIPTGKLFLSEALIVGNCPRQVKFSELTVDMYRLLQILEREPNEQQQLLLQQRQQRAQQQSMDQQHPNVSPQHQLYGAAAAPPLAGGEKSFNLLARPTFNSQQAQGIKGSPHKYTIFRPTFSQLFLFLASGFKELPQNGVLLLYLSADGSFGHMSADGDEAGYDLGGVATASGGKPGGEQQQQQMSSSASRSHLNQPTVGSSRYHYQYQASQATNQSISTAAVASGCGQQLDAGATGSGARSLLRPSQSMHFKQPNCLHPGDLYPFTRKPLVLVIDSNNSYAFQHIPRHFGLPLLVLMSPTEYPTPFNDNTDGSLFTLFLHCPLTALCSISNIIELPETIWRDAQFYIEKFYTELSAILLQSRSLDPTFISLCSDDFLRLLIFRFIFCFMAMRLHKLFRTFNYHPRSYPQLPEAELLQHPVLKQIISDLTVTLDIRTLFD